MNNRQTLTISEYELPISIEQEDNAYIARCPVWSDCYAQADSLEDVITEITYVASSLIELYKEEDMKIPLKLKKTAEQPAHRLSFTVPVIVSTS